MTAGEDSAARWRRVEELYLEMLRRAPEERAAALADACAGEPEILSEVQSLLDAPESAARLLAVPVLDVAGQLEVGKPGSLSGRRLGPFEVFGLLGVGGMGEVYRGRDSRLGRAVAIKIVPPHLTSEPDRLARFERESRALASLSHPNIGTLFGLEEADGVRALVLELVEGETLAVRIQRSPLPPADAAAIARQIAEGLDAAHEKGIVHRDLKPANIMLTPAGAVKILDFGLAKVEAGEEAALSTAPPGGTLEGIILGTPAYMSPEQARGKGVDKRTDIWAFGCVLFEMLTGRQAFPGETASDTIAAILEREVDWSALPAAAPAHVRRVLERCLTKDVELRLRDIGDAARELSRPVQAGRRAFDLLGFRWRRPALAALAAAALLAALGLLLSDGKRSETRRLFEISLPPGAVPASVISPDGRSIAYVAAGAGSPSMLWVRPLDSLDSIMLAGTEGAKLPFWSPDSRSIGFFTSGKVNTIAAGGGPVAHIADVEGCVGGAGGAWGRDGTIVFGSPSLTAVRVPGGEALRVAVLDETLEERCHGWPFFLPDGRHVLYLSMTTALEKRAVYIASLDSPRKTRLMDENSRAVYAHPGFVLFAREGALMARAFDPGQMAFSGSAARRVAESVRQIGPGLVAASVSDDGLLTYELPASPPARSWAWVDRSGRTTGELKPGPSDGVVRLSPDGRRVAFSELATDPARSSLSVYDIDRGTSTKLTDSDSANHWPAWSPDGSRLAFDSTRGDGRHALYELPSDGAKAARRLLHPPPGTLDSALDWSRDGKYLLFKRAKIAGRAGELWVLPTGGDAKAFRLLEGPIADEATLSPDGRFVAYTSFEAGARQVVLRSFPDATRERRQVSSEGGSNPRWAKEGDELFYLDLEGRVVAVPVTPGPEAVLGKAAPLFTAVPPVAKRAGSIFTFDVTADGRRFLIPGPPTEPSRRVVVIPDWASGLKQE